MYLHFHKNFVHPSRISFKVCVWQKTSNINNCVMILEACLAVMEYSLYICIYILLHNILRNHVNIRKRKLYAWIVIKNIIAILWFTHLNNVNWNKVNQKFIYLCGRKYVSCATKYLGLLVITFHYLHNYILDMRKCDLIAHLHRINWPAMATD